MITFIISHKEHSCPSCDVIHSDQCVPASDVRLLPIRSLPTGARAGTPSSPPSSLSPSPVAYVQTGSTSALASFSSLLDSTPLLPPLCELTSPHITRFSPSQSHTNQCREYVHTHTHCWRDPATLMVIVCRLRLRAFLEYSFKCV